jgi:phosphoglycolate phosphatase-like HAD superfamily hydrolase
VPLLALISAPCGEPIVASDPQEGGYAAQLGDQLDTDARAERKTPPVARTELTGFTSPSWSRMIRICRQTPSTAARTEIFVIGDMPLDIQAAHAVGCTAVAVATGHYDSDALRKAGADHVLETLKQELPTG